MGCCCRPGPSTHQYTSIFDSNDYTEVFQPPRSGCLDDEINTTPTCIQTGLFECCGPPPNFPYCGPAVGNYENHPDYPCSENAPRDLIKNVSDPDLLYSVPWQNNPEIALYYRWPKFKYIIGNMHQQTSDIDYLEITAGCYNESSIDFSTIDRKGFILGMDPSFYDGGENELFDDNPFYCPIIKQKYLNWSSVNETLQCPFDSWGYGSATGLGRVGDVLACGAKRYRADGEPDRLTCCPYSITNPVSVCDAVTAPVIDTHCFKLWKKGPCSLPGLDVLGDFDQTEDKPLGCCLSLSAFNATNSSDGIWEQNYQNDSYFPVHPCKGYYQFFDLYETCGVQSCTSGEVNCCGCCFANRCCKQITEQLEVDWGPCNIQNGPPIDITLNKCVGDCNDFGDCLEVESLVEPPPSNPSD